ncbi:NAD-dependent epimerase/dehydratase family protein [Bacillus sp. HMF5848]|uniref:NAD-dependent epimerase/dehydratase family protein n=1 Tax=Bacillus sp. HMF5848 TaxID=2495421 RepID=UPI000F783C59|nr:NAD-dependent epimerase/dehydratase family protein [Bacillus sp. HMF5848]RSK28326.1 NAD-dependent epimerase/dehydratase family protein [Bacillus sp. HMF5848]
MKKVIVTGGSGFIGSHILEELQQQGYESYNIDIKKPTYIKDNFIQCDVRSETDVLEIFAEIDPDYVIHLAAQTSVPYSMKNATDDAINNIIGTVNVLEACKAMNVKKIIFASTAAVYGDPDSLPIKEESPLRPLSPYGQSKKTAEEYIRLYRELYGLKYVILRFGNVFGPRQKHGGEAGVISIFMNQIIQNHPIEVYGSGNQTRDFIYVKDIVKANLVALKNDESDTFNISSETQMKINDIISDIEHVVNKKLHVTYKDRRLGDIEHNVLSTDKAKNQLKWKPLYSFKEGLSDYYHYLMKEMQVHA